jgi:transcriptional antiterminator RfaH
MTERRSDQRPNDHFMDRADAMNDINEGKGMNENDPSLWYVVQTKVGNEHRAQTHLLNQEIETFLPLLDTLQCCNGKMVHKIKPFFPNYLFARLDLKLQYCKVKWTRGVSRILGTGNGPTPISEKVIQSIKERTGEDHIVKLEERWKEGDVVQITSGPLKDLVGIFHRKLSDSGRVKILLSLIGVDIPVQISQWQIKKVA